MSFFDKPFDENSKPSPYPEQFRSHLQQAEESCTRYEDSGDVDALKMAIAAWESILNDPAFAQSDEVFRLGVWNNAAVTFLSEHKRTKQVVWLDKALQLWQQAVAAAPEDYPYSHADLAS